MQGAASGPSDPIPERYDEYGVASVYAEFAHQRGWLKPDRVLDRDAYAVLRGTVRQWAGEDRVWSDVVAEFGTPSMLFGSNNPYYGKTLGYLTGNPQDPMVSFRLWNGSTPGVWQAWPPEHEDLCSSASTAGWVASKDGRGASGPVRCGGPSHRGRDARHRNFGRGAESTECES